MNLRNQETITGRGQRESFRNKVKIKFHENCLMALFTRMREWIKKDSSLECIINGQFTKIQGWDGSLNSYNI